MTAFASSADTGEPLGPVSAPNMLIAGKAGLAKRTILLANPPGFTINRQIDGVVLTAADGTVVAICHYIHHLCPENFSVPND